jgi:hypothetical protein
VVFLYHIHVLVSAYLWAFLGSVIKTGEKRCLNIFVCPLMSDFHTYTRLALHQKVALLNETGRISADYNLLCTALRNIFMLS